MDKLEKQNLVSFRICKIDDIYNCPFCDEMRCSKYGKCFVKEKTEEQLDYVLSPIDENIYLEACAGSGKTEALGIKAAYELSNWESRDSGIAFLSFTNDAKDTIDDRIKKYCTEKISSKHFIGTFSSFVHIDDSVVLSRGQSIIDKIKTSKNSLDKHRLIKAIQLWQHDIIEDKKEAMILLAKEITKWLDTPGAALQYYCPKDYCDSVFDWRLALRNIMNELCDNPSINSFDGLTYSEWYKSAKEIIPSIINRCVKECFSINSFDFESIKSKIIAPKGTAKKSIDTTNNASSSEISIKTVHSAKGETYEAVLYISGKTKANKESYWKNWLDNETEPNRIAYVASTRPRQLLCWALPKLSEEDRKAINGLGMIEYVFE